MTPSGEVTATLLDPAAVMDRLEAIEQELAETQNRLEDAATRWFKTKRDRELQHARTFMGAEGTVAERNAAASIATADMGWEDEGRWEALKAKTRVLDTRAAVGMSILRAQSRVSG